jgi:fructosamine-3-kinase
MRSLLLFCQFCSSVLWLCLALFVTMARSIYALFALTFLKSNLSIYAFSTILPFQGATILRRHLQRHASHLQMSKTTEPYIEALSQAASEALGRTVRLEPASGGGFSGGGGASTSAVVDSETGIKYFVKAASGARDMLKAEYLGVKDMAETNTIRVPTPVAFGDHGNRAFVIFEYLEFCSGGSHYELGQQLAKMHRHVSDKGFGFHVDNTIGATPQPNLPWLDDWADFWDQHRLGHMLMLTHDAGYSADTAKQLRKKTRELLSHTPEPSLIHGDLWGGNKSFCKDGDKVVPCIFDPATYYGDREADVAMTYVFGGFSGDFYKGYEEEWPLPEGHENRRTVYNLYHILNHEVLFGGGYSNQARGMIEQILRM